MFDYFRGSNIVKNRNLNNVNNTSQSVRRFHKKVDFSEPEVFQDEFAMDLRKIDEFLDTETPGEKLGQSDVYDAAKTNWANLGKGPPGLKK